MFWRVIDIFSFYVWDIWGKQKITKSLVNTGAVKASWWMSFYGVNHIVCVNNIIIMYYKILSSININMFIYNIEIFEKCSRLSLTFYLIFLPLKTHYLTITIWELYVYVYLYAVDLQAIVPPFIYNVYGFISC